MWDSNVSGRPNVRRNFLAERPQLEAVDGRWDLVTLGDNTKVEVSTGDTKNALLSIQAFFCNIQALPGELASISFLVFLSKNGKAIYKVVYVTAFHINSAEKLSIDKEIGERGSQIQLGISALVQKDTSEASHLGEAEQKIWKTVDKAVK